ncbi:HD domain-containing protein [Tenacibaculum ascidiaceicola]|uniref:HD domain-containing protein n=1 Tax=Tenacibaculum ascidiaceicola TaxID=1699411 RepID=UPI003CE4E172
MFLFLILQKNIKNTKEELKAAKRIFGILPENQAQELINLWLEFEEGITNEAQFAKAMDRFEPILQNTSNKGGTWREFMVPKEKVIDKTKSISKGSETIWDYSQNEIELIFNKF